MPAVLIQAIKGVFAAVFRGAVPYARSPHGARAYVGVKLLCSPALVYNHKVSRSAMHNALSVVAALLLVALGGTQHLFFASSLSDE